MMLAYSPINLDSDSIFHINRLVVLIDAIKSGDYPTYIDYNSIDGYGYFTKAFYPDFMLLPFAILGLFTDIAFVYKFIIFSTTFLCGVTTFVAVKKVYKSSFCAIIASLLYTFSAYKLYQTFYFSVIQEIITFIFLPIVVWGLYEIIAGNYKKWYILTIGFAAIILTHVMTFTLVSIITIVFLLIYCKRFYKEPVRIKFLLISAICCILICAYFVFPMLEQMMSNSFYYKDKPLFTSIFFRPSLSNFMSGIINPLSHTDHADYIPRLGGFFIFFICLRIFIREKSQQIRSIDIMVILGIFLIILNIEYFPWHIFPFNKFIFIQFPWRLYKYASLFFAIAGGFYISRLIINYNYKIAFTAFLSLLISFMFILDSNDYQAMTGQRVKLDSTTEKTIKETVTLGGGAEYLPSKMPSQNYPFERGVIVTSLNEETLINNFSKEKGTITADITTNKDVIELPLTYYKGYKATLDSESISVEQSDNGLVAIPVNKSGHIKVWYTGTTIQKASFIITLISIFSLFVYLFINTPIIVKNRE